MAYCNLQPDYGVTQPTTLRGAPVHGSTRTGSTRIQPVTTVIQSWSQSVSPTGPDEAPRPCSSKPLHRAFNLLGYGYSGTVRLYAGSGIDI